jgi:hypothetical protein
LPQFRDGGDRKKRGILETFGKHDDQSLVEGGPESRIPWLWVTQRLGVKAQKGRSWLIRMKTHLFPNNETLFVWRVGFHVEQNYLFLQS